MKLEKLGEFGLIERFQKAVKTDATVVQGSGDDCAVLKFDKNRYQLFTCDMIVQDVDFTLQDRPELIGRKSIAVSISDIASCGGMPKHCLISLGMPKTTEVKYVDSLFKGMLEICKQFKVNIVGGDLSRAAKITIDVSMLGLVEKKNLILRGGAKEGDIIFITGPLGGSIFGKHLKFIPRVKESRFLVNNFKVNAMIDVSDGLIQDLGHILKQSKVGAVIFEKLIPLSKQARNLGDALYGGEDFELLFTLNPEEAREILKKKPVNFHPIGEITAKEFGLKLIDKKNNELDLKPMGFRHF